MLLAAMCLTLLLIQWIFRAPPLAVFAFAGAGCSGCHRRGRQPAALQEPRADAGTALHCTALHCRLVGCLLLTQSLDCPCCCSPCLTYFCSHLPLCRAACSLWFRRCLSLLQKEVQLQSLLTGNNLQRLNLAMGAAATAGALLPTRPPCPPFQLCHPLQSC